MSIIWLDKGKKLSIKYQNPRISVVRFSASSIYLYLCHVAWLYTYISSPLSYLSCTHNHHCTTPIMSYKPNSILLKPILFTSSSKWSIDSDDTAFTEEDLQLPHTPLPAWSPPWHCQKTTCQSYHLWDPIILGKPDTLFMFQGVSGQVAWGLQREEAQEGLC